MGQYLYSVHRKIRRKTSQIIVNSLFFLPSICSLQRNSLRSHTNTIVMYRGIYKTSGRQMNDCRTCLFSTSKNRCSPSKEHTNIYIDTFQQNPLERRIAFGATNIIHYGNPSFALSGAASTNSASRKVAQDCSPGVIKYSFSCCISRRGGLAHGHSSCSNKNRQRTSAFVTVKPRASTSNRPSLRRPSCSADTVSSVCVSCLSSSLVPLSSPVSCCVGC